MKMLTRYCAGPAYYRDVLNRRLLFKTNRQQEAPKETITHHFFVSGIGQKKTVDAAKICGGAENVVKNRNPANIRKWIARFYYFRHLYSAGSACVLLTILYRASPIDMATPSALLINDTSGFLPAVFVISLSEGEIIPFSGVCQSGEAALSTPEAVASRTGLDRTALWQPTTTSGNIITQYIIFSFSIS